MYVGWNESGHLADAGIEVGEWSQVEDRVWVGVLVIA